MRFISAEYIFPVVAEPLKNGTVIINKENIIVDVLPYRPDDARLEIFNGIICPGFINAHCHLELSYMKGLLPKPDGISEFIKELVNHRGAASDEIIKEGIVKAEQDMIRNGIVAVGDVSNNAITFKQKAFGNLYYHTFIELFDLHQPRAEEVFEQGVILEEQYKECCNKNGISITPHAPYSASKELFEMITHHAEKNNAVISIHNQESEAENELFQSKSGKVFEFLSGSYPLDHLSAAGKSSLQSYFNYLPLKNKILLVHNTFTSKEDIGFAHSRSANIYWCFCPNANLHIENSLPDFNIFIEEKAKCCIGTDSYASNNALSVLEEIKIISSAAPDIPLQMLLKWATHNGAEFLGIDHVFGSIAKSKKPGLNLIENIDLNRIKLTEKSRVTKIA